MIPINHSNEVLVCRLFARDPGSVSLLPFILASALFMDDKKNMDEKQEAHVLQRKEGKATATFLTTRRQAMMVTHSLLLVMNQCSSSAVAKTTLVIRYPCKHAQGLAGGPGQTGWLAPELRDPAHRDGSDTRFLPG